MARRSGTLALRAVVLFGLLAATPLSAQDLRDPEFTGKAMTGFRHLFNMDYEVAIDTFSALRREYAHHPGPPLYMATAIWLGELNRRNELDLDKFVSPAHFGEPTSHVMPPGEREKFFRLVAESQARSEAILKTDPQDLDARYFLGTSFGVLGAFSITVDHSKSDAFKYGKKAYQYHSEIVEEDPEYYDAYMSVGMYEYIVGNLPWYIKWLAVIIGYRGSEERGFEYLRLASEKGQYVADEARVLQMVLYVREREYGKALGLVRYMREKYPRSYLLHLNEAYILEKMGRKEEAAAQYLQVVHHATAGRANYHRLDLSTLHYNVGKKLLELGQWSSAQNLLEQSVRNPQTPERERVLSHLYLGQALDAQGKRQQAVEQYHQVLRLKEFEDSHDAARRFLRRPFPVSGIQSPFLPARSPSTRLTASSPFAAELTDSGC